jgi:hypothetical protein
VAAVKSDKSANTSRKNLERTKFEIWPLDRRLKEAREAKAEQGKKPPAIVALRLPMFQIPWLARRLKQLFDEPRRTRSSWDRQPCDPIRLNFVTYDMFSPTFMDTLAIGGLNKELRKIEDKYQSFWVSPPA